MDKVSQQLSTYLSRTVVYEEEIATHSFEILESILTSDSYTHEHETTLDYPTPDLEFDGCEADPDNGHEDIDYEEKDMETKVFEDATLSYMKRSLEFYDTINPKKGKRKYIWKNVKITFNVSRISIIWLVFENTLKKKERKTQKNRFY